MDGRRQTELRPHQRPWAASRSPRPKRSP